MAKAPITAYVCPDQALEETNRERYRARYSESIQGNFPGIMNAEYDSPYQRLKDVSVKSFAFSNVHGGTVLVEGKVRTHIEGKWWDEETGWHYMGRVLAIEKDCISKFDKQRCMPPSYVFFGEFDVAK